MKKKMELLFIIIIEAIVCFTPLGSIPIGPIVATLSCIPVIVASLYFRDKEGMIVGLCFGLFSFIVWTIVPPNPAFSFVFTPFYEGAEYHGNIFSLIICFIPRILTGLTPLLTYNLLKKAIKKDILSLMISSMVGSITNTILVMLFIYIAFSKEYSTLIGLNMMDIIKITITTNGIVEAILAMIISPAIVLALRKI